MPVPSASRHLALLALAALCTACPGESPQERSAKPSTNSELEASGSAKVSPPKVAPTAAPVKADTHNEAPLDPDLEERLRVGIKLIRGEKFDEARAWFEKMAKERPDAAAAHYNLGWLHDRAGRLEPAIESYRQAIVLDREHPRAYNNLGYSLQKAGRTDEAIDTWIEGIARVPENQFARNNLKKLIGQLRCPE